MSSAAAHAAAHPLAASTPAWDWFWCELDGLQARWNPLLHPFYARWTAGELERSELAAFAEEYDHLVVALAAVAAHAAVKAAEPLSDLLRYHAAEEREHVLLWTGFSKAAGWSLQSAWHYACDPCTTTIACARTWAGSPQRPLALDLVTVYAATSMQAEVVRASLPSLLGRYGFGCGVDTEYQRRHAHVDRRHAGLASWALARGLAAEDPPALLAQAEAVLRSHWQLLDELQAAGGSSADQWPGGPQATRPDGNAG